MTIAEKVELHLIDKSNIRRFIPFMNFYILILSSLIIFAVSFIYVHDILRFIPSTAMICLVFSLIPYYILGIMGKYNSELIRKKLSYFISVLLRWYSVKEDIFYAFEKSIDSGIGEPLKSFIKDMLVQINKGMEPVEALDMLQLKVDNQQFREFIINVKHCIKRKGDMFVLLNNLGDQFYKIEEEFNRRKISTYRDRITIVAVMIAVLLIGWYLLKTQPKIYQLYLGTVEGKMLLTFFTVLYAAGFYLFTNVTKFKH
jgi:Flp pilus assembly protein TadB